MILCLFVLKPFTLAIVYSICVGSLLLGKCFEDAANWLYVKGVGCLRWTSLTAPAAVAKSTCANIGAELYYPRFEGDWKLVYNFFGEMCFSIGYVPCNTLSFVAHLDTSMLG